MLPEFYLYKTEKAPELNKNQAIYRFEFDFFDPNEANATVIYSIDNFQDTARLEDGVFEVKATAGNHIFQVYINENYQELYSDSLATSSRTKAFYKVRLSDVNSPVLIDKPVIYLYPEVESNFEIVVKPAGEFTFLYPAYDNGWEGTMSPNGNLKMNGETYRYLFWESEQIVQNILPSETSGFVVDQANLFTFIEETLTSVGFNSQEKADFITYWVPRMLKYNRIFIAIDQNEKCDQFATLEVNPTPNHLHRFYISWGEYNGDFIPKTPKLSKINRQGFTVLEWGGTEINIINENEI